MGREHDRVPPAQVRRHLGFRECSAEDGGKLTEWLAGNVCQAERRADRVREELLARCRAERIEPPSAGRCDRIIRSALHQAEQTLTLRVTSRLDPAASTRLAALAEAADDEDAAPSALSLIKSVPGNVSLESMAAAAVVVFVGGIVSGQLAGSYWARHPLLRVQCRVPFENTGLTTAGQVGSTWARQPGSPAVHW